MASSAGKYVVVITNAFGSLESQPAILTIGTGGGTGGETNAAPVIVQQPLPVIAAPGGVANFAVVATGSFPMAFQWKKGGVPILGATNLVLTLKNLGASDVAQYSVSVINSAGTVESQSAQLKVDLTADPKLVIVLHPMNLTVPAGGVAALGVAANGAVPMVFQWKKDGTVLLGETNPVVVITNVTTANVGKYTVVVSNVAGSVESQPGSLTLGTGGGGGGDTRAPMIVQQPVSLTVPAGGVANFAVLADGAFPMAFQWKKDGVNLQGATNPTVTLSNLVASSAGKYVVVITNAFGSIESQPAILTVEPVIVPQVKLVAGQLTAPSGSSVAVPFKVFGFTNVTSIRFSLEWDPAVLKFQSIQDSVPGVVAENFGTNSISEGRLTFVWTGSSTTPATIPDGTAVFTVGFRVLGEAGKVSRVAAVDVPIQREVTIAGKPGVLECAEGGVTAVLPINTPPVLAVVSDQKVDEGKPLGLNLSASDSDLPAQVLSFQLVGGPAGLTVSSKGVLSWTPTEDQGPSTNQVLVSVTDGVASVTNQFMVVVREVNAPPILAEIPRQKLGSDQDLNLTLSASDTDFPAQALEFSLKNGPKGMTVSLEGKVSWKPQVDQRPSTNTVTIRVADGESFAEQSFVVEVEAPEATVELAGRTIDGYVAGAKVWFDANLNGKLDANEPATETDRTGQFELQVPLSTFDKNQNGKIDADEGRIVSEGGVDLSTGEARVGQLVAPAGSTVVTPLTTLVDAVSRATPGLSAVAAEEQVRAALSLPESVSLTQFDPVVAAQQGDERAVSVQVAAASVSDTVTQLAKVFDASSGSVSEDQAAKAVTQALANQIAMGSPVDLGSQETIKQAVAQASSSLSTTLSPQVVEIVATVVSDQNTAKVEAVILTENPLEALQQVAQVQTVSQGESADTLAALGAGKVGADEVLLRFTGEGLQAAITNAPVGDLTGTSVIPGTFSLSRDAGVATEDGRSVESLVVVRREGTQGVVRVRLDITGPAGLLKASSVELEFGDGELQQVVNYADLIHDDNQPQADRVATLKLSLAAGSPSEAKLGALTQANLTVLDNDTAGTVGFAETQYNLLEDGTASQSVVLERTGGTAGKIIVTIEMGAGTAQAGTDYTASPLTVEFSPGEVRKVVRVPVLDDGDVESSETVVLTAKIAAGSAVGAGLTSGFSSATVTIQDNDELIPARLEWLLVDGATPRLKAVGKSGRRHRLEVSTDMKSWVQQSTTIITTTGDSSSVEVDAGGVSSKARFFRLIPIP